MRFIFIICFALLCYKPYAQTAQKPTASFNDEKTQIKTNISSLNVIKNQEDFNKLARVFNQGTVNEIPHLLFVIDRRKSNKVHYINTPKHEFHVYFINELLGENYTPQDIQHFYVDSTRRFIFGTVSYQNLIKGYTYEFWEGDKITSKLLLCAQKAITTSFFDTIVLKTNSTLQENLAKSLSIKHITQEQLVKESPYIALNMGTTQGRICIADSIDNITDIGEYDILVLREVPIAIPAVAGIITERASTLLSHVNILAHGLGIPSIYVKDACAKMQPYNHKFVELKADMNGYTITEIAEPKDVKRRSIKYSIRSDIKMNDIRPLAKILASDNIYFGVKAANLGEMKANIKTAVVPDGFAIPFAQYNTFVKKNRIRERLDSIQHLPNFYEQTAVRRTALENLRANIENASVDSATVLLWVRQWESQLRHKGVFVRSSSNAEDLKNFSGAGLFTTVPNVKTAQELEKAVKRVWASVYNFEAYESRSKAGIPDSLIMMSVFVQLATNSDISGVMITKDPYNPLRKGITYIAAKRGIGIKVVEGKRIAEQVMYTESTKSVQLISRSAEDTELKLDEQGGVKEIPLKNQNRVMTDELVTALANCGKSIKKLFKDDMDIEWAVSKNQLIILQARPYK